MVTCDCCYKNKSTIPHVFTIILRLCTTTNKYKISGLFPCTKRQLLLNKVKVPCKPVCARVSRCLNACSNNSRCDSDNSTPCNSLASRSKSSWLDRKYAGDELTITDPCVMGKLATSGTNETAIFVLVDDGTIVVAIKVHCASKGIYSLAVAWMTTYGYLN